MAQSRLLIYFNTRTEFRGRQGTTLGRPIKLVCHALIIGRNMTTANRTLPDVSELSLPLGIVIRADVAELLEKLGPFLGRALRLTGLYPLNVTFSEAHGLRPKIHGLPAFPFGGYFPARIIRAA